jgi:hypothetical protein
VVDLSSIFLSIARFAVSSGHKPEHSRQPGTRVQHSVREEQVRRMRELREVKSQEQQKRTPNYTSISKKAVTAARIFIGSGSAAHKHIAELREAIETLSKILEQDGVVVRMKRPVKA